MIRLRGVLLPPGMYNAFFGFTQNPFNMSPDPSFLFRSLQHEEALANLIYGVQSRKGFIVLTGEVGTGKTTMLECLRDFLHAQHIAFASLFNSRLTVEQFFEMLAEIRLLGNLENRRGKLLQIILAGQQELDEKLERPEYRQLKQRIALRCVLRGFDVHDVAAYIDSRMARAGVPNQTFISREIIEEITFRSQGIPRLINAICDNLLLTCFAMETRTATMEMLDEVTADMRLDYPAEQRRTPVPLR